MKLSNQKLKLLYLAKILYEKTDEEHTLTVAELIKELDKYGISSERKSMYNDLECLKLFGIDLCVRKSRTYDYFIGSRLFELPELKLLVDSVECSKFITYKKSNELISKLEKLTSKNNANKLQRQVYVSNRIKSGNETIYYSVDKIHEAIATNKKISFKYYDIGVSKKKIYRKKGERYVESPVALTFDDEKYYLITYKEKYDTYVHYRVDKMESIDILSENRILKDEEFDLSKYTKGMFSMFGGEIISVKMEFKNELAGVVTDRFGKDVIIMKKDEEWFTCKAEVALSPYFLSWIISFGKNAKIISPKKVKNELLKLLSDVKSVY